VPARCAARPLSTEKSHGAGQIVGRKGHGIPVVISNTLSDLTTSTVLVSESIVAGNGHAHRNQRTTTCTRVFFEGSAAEFFGEEERRFGSFGGDGGLRGAANPLQQTRSRPS
jgi:hypothetical protein